MTPKPNSLRRLLAVTFARETFPWVCLTLFLVVTLLQALGPAAREALIYDKAHIAAGQIWRIWTGHLVHFGWQHWLGDAWLFLLLGRILERRNPWITYSTLLFLPLVTAEAITLFVPAMLRYAGLSAINVSLLIFLSLRGWSTDRREWIWPAILALHALEMLLEIHQGGQGGAMVAFDDPTVKVATTAHLAGILVGVLSWLAWRKTATK